MKYIFEDGDLVQFNTIAISLLDLPAGADRMVGVVYFDFKGLTNGWKYKKPKKTIPVIFPERFKEMIDGQEVVIDADIELFFINPLNLKKIGALEISHKDYFIN